MALLSTGPTMPARAAASLAFGERTGPCQPAFVCGPGIACRSIICAYEAEQFKSSVIDAIDSKPILLPNCLEIIMCPPTLRQPYPYYPPTAPPRKIGGEGVVKCR